MVKRKSQTTPDEKSCFVKVPPLGAREIQTYALWCDAIWNMAGKVATRSQRHIDSSNLRRGKMLVVRKNILTLADL